MPKAGKTGVIENHPNSQTIKFGGKFINLSAISRAQNIDPSYLSRIFSGRRAPNLTHSKKIAAMLGLTLDDFVEALEIRLKEVREMEGKIIQSHLERVSKEDKEDLDSLKRGVYPAPRLPGLRARQY